MLLVVDIGNTNIVLGIYREKELLCHWRISTDRQRTSDEYGILIYNLFQHGKMDMKQIHSVIISSVVPPLRHSATKAAMAGSCSSALASG